MKIDYIANVRLPTEKAHGIQIIKMCEAFALTSQKVRLIAPLRVQKKELRNKNIYKFYRVKKIFKLVFMPNLDLLFLEKWFRVGPVFFLIQDLSFSLAACLEVLRSRQDLIYTRSKTVALLLSLCQREFAYEAHVSAKGTWWDKIISRKAKKVVTITRPIEKSYQRLLAKTLYVPDGVSEEFFKSISKTQARKKVNLPQDKTIIGYVGNLVTLGQEKGVGTLIRAISLVSKTYKDVVGCIVGGPEEYREKYRLLVQRLGSQDKVTLTGQQPFARIPLYLRAMDILVIPFPNKPHFAYNASPLKLFEYMASNRPIVASGLPSIREVLSADSVVFFKPGSSLSLAKAIQRLVKNKPLARKLSQRTYRKAKQFTWEKRAQAIVASLQA